MPLSLRRNQIRVSSLAVGLSISWFAATWAAGCSTEIDLFPAQGSGGTGGQGDSATPEASFSGGLGGISGEAGASGEFPAKKGEPTLLQLNTEVTCPDDISLTSDLLEMYFDSEEGTLLTSRRESQLVAWSPAVPVAGIGVPGSDSGAEVSHDGLTLFWMSKRVEGSDLGTLWYSTRSTRSSSWGPATYAIELDQDSNEAFPTLTDDGLLIVFVKDQDLWSSSRESLSSPWGPTAVLPVVNTARADTAPALTGDGLTLFFSSTRLGGQGGLDLYVSHRASREEDFGMPEALSGLNTPGTENDPWISSDGQLLVFQRQESNATGCSFYSVQL